MSALTWVGAELGLGLVASIWEARHDALLRGHEFPRAILVRR
jgi:hypothetical protein